jgi:hypothetical protein
LGWFLKYIRHGRRTDGVRDLDASRQGGGSPATAEPITAARKRPNRRLRLGDRPPNTIQPEWCHLTRGGNPIMQGSGALLLQGSRDAGQKAPAIWSFPVAGAVFSLVPLVRWRRRKTGRPHMPSRANGPRSSAALGLWRFRDTSAARRWRLPPRAVGSERQRDATARDPNQVKYFWGYLVGPPRFELGTSCTPSNSAPTSAH